MNSAKEELKIKIEVRKEEQRLKAERERVNQEEKEMKQKMEEELKAQRDDLARQGKEMRQKVEERLAERKRKRADDLKAEDVKVKSRSWESGNDWGRGMPDWEVFGRIPWQRGTFSSFFWPQRMASDCAELCQLYDLQTVVAEYQGLPSTREGGPCSSRFPPHSFPTLTSELLLAIYTSLSATLARLGL